MTIFVVVYAIGFLFHAYLAYLEMGQVIRHGYHVTMLDHVRATVMIVTWPWLMLSLLYQTYVDRIRFAITDDQPGS